MDISPGLNIPLSLQLWDGDDSRFPQAALYFRDGSPFTTPKLNLSNVGNGLYANSTLVMPAVPLFVTYTVYTDNSYLEADEDHTLTDDVIIPAVSGGGGSSGPSANFGVATAEAYQPNAIHVGVVVPTIVEAEILEDENSEAQANLPNLIAAEAKNITIVEAIALDDEETT